MRREAYLVNDRTIEILLDDGRTIRINAMESLKSSGFSAEHLVALDLPIGDQTAIVWARADFPWATGDTIEDCLTSAIFLLNA